MSVMDNMYGRMGSMDRDAERNMETTMTVIEEFEKKATNGGTLELEIDRYGHVKCKVVINPINKVL